MFNLNSFVQKAQSLFDPTLSPISHSADSKPSKASLFRHQFRLPDSEIPLYEITAELTLNLPRPPSTPSPPNAAKVGRSQGNIYVGKLHLSDNYLCFSTQATSFLPSATIQAASAFTGQTNGSGPAGNGFTLPLCAIKKVERLRVPNALFALAVTTWNGSALTNGHSSVSSDTPRFTLQFAGSPQACDRFCDGLKKGLRNGIKQVENLKSVVVDCYSEYLVSSQGVKYKEIPNQVQPNTNPPDTGLGMLFRYPGNPRLLRDRSKMRYWAEYLQETGRNATLIRKPNFHKLIRVGLPNLLRGEMWELTSGSFFLRLQDPKLYSRTLATFSGRESLAIDEIEKDLNRSLPEYPGFQSEEGIGRLRRVLTAYSWVNEEVGYCQAMNIVVAALLIYMSEAQAFSILSVLCDRLLPGYYSITMYGTLLDQRVFESLVEETMPILWEHLVRSDVQLSVVSLPWFLSLYINSMPLIFAFRVLDMFFLEGPKVLFQVGLAILRINGEELLDVTDDGTFISILKTYFSRLSESAHPKSENEKLRGVTRFQELMVVAFQEFAGITQSTIAEQRAKHKDVVLDSIEIFAKRTSIRNLGPDSKRLNADDLSFLYDRYYGTLYERERNMHALREQSGKRVKAGVSKASDIVNGVSGSNGLEMGRVGMGPSPELMNYDGFRDFLARVTRWAVSDSPRTPLGDLPFDRDHRYLKTPTPRTRTFPSNPLSRRASEPADHDFMQRLYGRWNKADRDGLGLEDIVSGIADIKGSMDLMSSISYFFDLYDDDHDGKVDREGILRISEALLFLTRRGLEGNFTLIGSSTDGTDESVNGDLQESETTNGSNLGERFLNSVSAFIRRCFEYADPDNPEIQDRALTNGNNLNSAGVEEFTVGEEEEDDLIDISENGASSEPMNEKSENIRLAGNLSPPLTNSALDVPQSPHSPLVKQAANLALDPANPLHITLPTFRMVILADELLQQFFEFSFAESFHLSPTPIGRTSSSFSLQTPTLTTFSSIASRQAPSTPAAAVNAPASKGLRTVLDNIVSDGMRVAAEVRKKMEEAQKEMEKNALRREDDYDDDKEEAKTPGAYWGDAEGRSVREADRDLLEGPEVGSLKEAGEGLVDLGYTPLSSEGSGLEKILEFEN